MKSLPAVKEFNGYFNESTYDDETTTTTTTIQDFIDQEQFNFILEMISVIQQQTPTLAKSDTIMFIEIDHCLVPIISIKKLDDISLFLYVEKEAKSITICWGVVAILCCSEYLDMGHRLAIFNKAEDNQWKERALQKFAQEFKREIRITSIYVEDSLIKKEYHIKDDNNVYIEIGYDVFARFNFKRIFKTKTKKIAFTTLESFLKDGSGSVNLNV